MPALDDSVYRELILSSHNALCLTDTRQRIQLVNPAFTRLYGYEQEEIEGELPRFLNPGRAVYFENGVYHGEYDRLFRSMKEFLNRFMTEEPDGAGQADGSTRWEGRILNRCKDGSLVWVKMRLSPIRDAEGRITGFLGASENVSEELEADLAIRMEIYHAITDLAETRDNETGNHLRRIARYTGLLAEELGMPKAFVSQIEMFSPLHDIGKVGIPDYILLAPRKLSSDEFEIMQTHTSLGHRILAGRPTLEMAAEIAHFHHERYDGTGYPEGVGGGAIPISARITALADVYDALTSKRPYKDAWPHGEAANLILNERGRQFDPLLVDAFEARQSQFDGVRAELDESIEGKEG
jgi:HD-GYP domain-containing protein (c-di-GMP phosphodiesterase class II)